MCPHFVQAMKDLQTAAENVNVLLEELMTGCGADEVRLIFFTNLPSQETPCS